MRMGGFLYSIISVITIVFVSFSTNFIVIVNIITFYFLIYSNIFK